MRGNAWKEKEDDFLKANYITSNTDWISGILERSVQAIQQRAYKLGLKKRAYSRRDNKPWNFVEWTKEKEEFLIGNYQTLNNKDLAKALGMRITSVRTKLYSLGYKRMELEYWTEEQVQILKENYIQFGDVEMAEIFNAFYHKDKGWTNKHIEKKRRYLKLKRTAGQIAEIKKRNIAQGRYSLFHFKRWLGRVSEPGTIRTWKSQSGRPFLVIKTEDGFVHYARHLYETTVGPVPEGFVVSVKDNNPLNVVPENLELISRSELALKNSMTRMKYPEEMQETIKTLFALTNLIKEYEQQ